MTDTERINRRIGQLGRHAHAEIRRMADEARAEIDRMLGYGPEGPPYGSLDWWIEYWTRRYALPQWNATLSWE